MEKKKRTAILLGGVVLFLIIIIGVLIILLFRKEKTVPTSGREAEVYMIDEENYQQIVEDMEAEVKEGYFETYMNTEWTFPDGTTETTDAILGNSPNNTKPIRCEVQLEETGETVFTTGVLPVGAQVPPFKLDIDLDAGIYNAVCMVYLLNDVGNGTYTDYSSAGFNITITVKN